MWVEGLVLIDIVRAYWVIVNVALGFPAFWEVFPTYIECISQILNFKVGNSSSKTKELGHSGLIIEHLLDSKRFQMIINAQVCLGFMFFNFPTLDLLSCLLLS